MAGIDLDNLRSIRQALHISQREFAALLGLSSRAVQSYEQNWRTIPPYVQKLSSFFLAMKSPDANAAPCWKLLGCPLAVRRDCPAFQYTKGKFCWMVEGTLCSGKPEPWPQKLNRCKTCKVAQPWLNSPPA